MEEFNLLSSDKIGWIGEIRSDETKWAIFSPLNEEAKENLSISDDKTRIGIGDEYDDEILGEILIDVEMNRNTTSRTANIEFVQNETNKHVAMYINQEACDSGQTSWVDGEYNGVVYPKIARVKSVRALRHDLLSNDYEGFFSHENEPIPFEISSAINSTVGPQMAPNTSSDNTNPDDNSLTAPIQGEISVIDGNQPIGTRIHEDVTLEALTATTSSSYAGKDCFTVTGDSITGKCSLIVTTLLKYDECDILPIKRTRFYNNVPYTVTKSDEDDCVGILSGTVQLPQGEYEFEEDVEICPYSGWSGPNVWSSSVTRSDGVTNPNVCIPSSGATVRIDWKAVRPYSGVCMTPSRGNKTVTGTTSFTFSQNTSSSQTSVTASFQVSANGETGHTFEYRVCQKGKEQGCTSYVTGITLTPSSATYEDVFYSSNPNNKLFNVKITPDVTCDYGFDVLDGNTVLKSSTLNEYDINLLDDLHVTETTSKTFTIKSHGKKNASGDKMTNIFNYFGSNVKYTFKGFENYDCASVSGDSSFTIYQDNTKPLINVTLNKFDLDGRFIGTAATHLDNYYFEMDIPRNPDFTQSRNLENVRINKLFRRVIPGVEPTSQPYHNDKLNDNVYDVSGFTYKGSQIVISATSGNASADTICQYKECVPVFKLTYRFDFAEYTTRYQIREIAMREYNGENYNSFPFRIQERRASPPNNNFVADCSGMTEASYMGVGRYPDWKNCQVLPSGSSCNSITYPYQRYSECAECHSNNCDIHPYVIRFNDLQSSYYYYQYVYSEYQVRLTTGTEYDLRYCFYKRLRDENGNVIIENGNVKWVNLGYQTSSPYPYQYMTYYDLWRAPEKHGNDPLCTDIVLYATEKDNEGVVHLPDNPFD